MRVLRRAKLGHWSYGQNCRSTGHRRCSRARSTRCSTQFSTWQTSSGSGGLGGPAYLRAHAQTKDAIEALERQIAALAQEVRNLKAGESVG
jgi:hypothetical protein